MIFVNNVFVWHLLFIFYCFIGTQVQWGAQCKEKPSKKLLFLNKCPGHLISHLEHSHFTTEHKIYSLWKKWKQFDFFSKQKLTLYFDHFILAVALQPGSLHLTFFPFLIKTGQWSRSSNQMALVGTKAAGSCLFLAWIASQHQTTMASPSLVMLICQLSLESLQESLLILSFFSWKWYCCST